LRIETLQWSLLLFTSTGSTFNPKQTLLNLHQIPWNLQQSTATIPGSHCPNTPLPARADRLANLAGVGE
jgi:hypothetical protein